MKVFMCHQEVSPFTSLLTVPPLLASTWQEVTTDIASSHFNFTIPENVTPSFQSAMVSLQWALLFELQVGPPVDHSAQGANGRASATAYRTSSSYPPPVQQLLWNLPLLMTSPVVGPK